MKKEGKAPIKSSNNTIVGSNKVPPASSVIESTGKALIQSNEDGTATTGEGGGGTSHRTVIEIIGANDTRRDDLRDTKSQKILAKVSLEQMGNKVVQARKGKTRLETGHFGKESTLEAIKERVKNTEKAPQHTLGNVLGMGRTPGAPRPR